MLSGTPTASGTSSFTVQVRDSQTSPASEQAPLSVTVLNQLAVSTTELPNGISGAAYQATLTAAGGLPSYSWSLLSGSLPHGLSLSGGGVISGTPTAAGGSHVTVQVRDSEVSPATSQASLNVSVLNPLTVTTSQLSSGNQGVRYQASLAATGGVPPYSWNLISGSLPDGLTLSSGGRISGTPAAAGMSSFTVQVRDAETSPLTNETNLSINIRSDITVSTDDLPGGTVSLAYQATLSAINGDPPYTWNLLSGSLPAGLTLSPSGVISGTPNAVGTWSFEVQVNDSQSDSGSATLPLTIAATAQGAVTTQHNDNLRTGQNLNETNLTPALVSSGQFGKLFSQTVDGFVYAQPLYVPNVYIPGNGIHNVVYVATEHDSVYAWDADNNTGTNSTPLWQTSFINPSQGITTISSNDVNCPDGVIPEIGITGTPVIDVTTNTIYVLAETKENGSFFHRLHALDITTGAEKFGGPTVIAGSVTGTGAGSSGSTLTFDPLMHLNRPGLLLTSGGDIFIAWASNCDNPPFHGWIMSYNAESLQQTAIWASTPNGDSGGTWMSGAGIAADGLGSVYFATGNGTFDTSGSPVDFGDSVVRMTLSSSGPTVADYFTPYDQGNLESGDVDVASGGPLLLPDQPGPHPKELIQVGKEGSIYVIDRTNMGQYNPQNSSQIVQNLTGQVLGIYGTPAYWNGNVYFGASYDALKGFSLTNGMLSSTPTSLSELTFTYPGATPSISANGNTGAILWILQTDTQNNGNEVLRAYDATNLATELYDSNQNLTRDNPGGAVKYAVPTIVNGKVYAGSASAINVYGNLSPLSQQTTNRK